MGRKFVLAVVRTEAGPDLLRNRLVSQPWIAIIKKLKRRVRIRSAFLVAPEGMCLIHLSINIRKHMALVWLVVVYGHSVNGFSRTLHIDRCIQCIYRMKDERYFWITGQLPFCCRVEIPQGKRYFRWQCFNRITLGNEKTRRKRQVCTAGEANQNTAGVRSYGYRQLHNGGTADGGQSLWRIQTNCLHW